MALLATACGTDEGVEVVSGAVTAAEGGTDTNGTGSSIDDSGPTTDMALEEDVDGADPDADMVSDPPAQTLDATPEPGDDEPSGLPVGDAPLPVVADEDGVGWQVVRQRSDLSDSRPHPIIELVDRGDQVAVRFESIPEGCSGAEAFADESINEVRIELFVGLPPEAASTTCMMMQVKKEIIVQLNSEVGARNLVAVELLEPQGDSVMTPEVFLEDYIGMAAPDAIEKAEISGRDARIVWLQGEFLPATDDYRPRRLNLHVLEGIVIGLSTDAGEVAGDVSGN